MTAKAKRVGQQSSFFQTKLGRVVAENLTAYTFLLPAFLIIFIFNIFPVAFAFIVSLHRWRRFPEGWRGLDSYVDALGNFAYVAFFWLAIGAFVYALYSLWRMLRDAHEDGSLANLTMLIPGVSWAITSATFINWFFEIILVIYDIPNRTRGQDVTRELFVNEFFNSFTFPQVVQAVSIMLTASAIPSQLTA